MNSDIQIIVEDANGMTLNGKPVEFNRINKTHSSHLIRIASARDIGDAITQASEEAKKLAVNYNSYAVLEIYHPSPMACDPEDPNRFRLSSDNRFYLFRTYYYDNLDLTSQ